MAAFTAKENGGSKLMSHHHDGLKDRVALITGSGRGLGQATALRLAQDGADIVVNDLNRENAEAVSREIEKMGRKSFASTHDVSSHSSAKALIDEIKARFGRLDILVNNAGITRDSMLHKTSEEKFDEVIRVNLKGVFNCSQAAAPLMVEQKWGRIISLSSIAALGNIGQTNYSASKAAVIGMTRTMALELAKYNVTVNAIAPGLFESALTQAIPAEVKEKFINRIPLKRIGDPREIASLAAFLASNEASYMTGQTLFLDGGLSIGVSGI
ncbi:MAG: 3-oxoacyl-ACP reductase FabG [Bdellovibrionota bacterium]